MAKRSNIVLVALLQLLSVALQSSAAGYAPAPAPAAGVPGTNVSSLPPLGRKIDTHCHFIPEFYREELRARNITSGGFTVPQWNITYHLEVNAIYNITTSVFSISTPGAKLSENDTDEAGRTLARQLNEYAYNLTLEYPKKVLFFGTLTLPDVDGAVAEAIYALDTLNAAGVMVEASAFGELFGTRRYDPLYQVLNERRAVVFIHPSNSPCPESTLTAASPAESTAALPPYLVDFLLDTTRAAMELVYTNVTTDYPEITFILAHSGGFLPFAASRAAGGLALLSGNAANINLYEEKLSTFNIDLALSATRTALPSTLAFFNTTQITFGSDFPYSPILGVRQNVLGLLNSGLRIGKGTLNRLNYVNAYRLFRKFLK